MQYYKSQVGKCWINSGSTYFSVIQSSYDNLCEFSDAYSNMLANTWGCHVQIQRTALYHTRLCFGCFLGDFSFMWLKSNFLNQSWNHFDKTHCDRNFMLLCKCKGQWNVLKLHFTALCLMRLKFEKSKILNNWAKHPHSFLYQYAYVWNVEKQT